MAFKVPDIPGAEDVVRWFGQWPSFHDAEVISIALHRSKGVIVEMHAFETSSEVDTRGYYVQAKHAIITFALDGFPMNAEGIASTRIDYFNHQNVLSGVDIESTRWLHPDTRWLLWRRCCILLREVNGQDTAGHARRQYLRAVCWLRLGSGLRQESSHN